MITFTIEEIAQQTRRQFELKSTDTGLLINLYREYADVGDTARFVSKARDIFPIGNCGIASLLLKEKLGGEIVRGKYREQRHTFLVVDSIIVDITADQFGGPKVYVGPLRPPWSLA